MRPPGTRGISLFLVPKFLPDGTRNDVRCHGIEHKLGIHALADLHHDLRRSMAAPSAGSSARKTAASPACSR